MLADFLRLKIVTGLWFVISFDNRIRDFCSCQDLKDRFVAERLVLAKWKPAVFDPIVCTVQLISALVAGDRSRRVGTVRRSIVLHNGSYFILEGNLIILPATINIPFPR